MPNLYQLWTKDERENKQLGPTAAKQIVSACSPGMNDPMMHLMGFTPEGPRELGMETETFVGQVGRFLVLGLTKGCLKRDAV